MSQDQKSILQKVADTIRVISAEAVEKATCGHPGLPMGCAEIGALLFSKYLRHNPKNPQWIGRDRFVLSAGHGSMFQYCALHLSGYDVSLDDLKNFRQLHSKTPGHPEFGDTPGVETTTGPLGQGFASATGMAMASKWLAARFGDTLFNNKVWVLTGDGDMMEGISHETANLAGHLKLDNLIVIYDSNDICLDGPTSECFSEDTAKRFDAYGWNVIQLADGNDLDQIDKAMAAAVAEKSRPTLIVAKTVIGKGSPNKEGSNDAHGAALGANEVKLTKQGLGWPEEAFYVPAEVYAFFNGLQSTFEAYEAEWNANCNTMQSGDAELAKLWDVFATQGLPADFADQIWNMDVAGDKATRAQSGQIIAKVAQLAPYFVTGSADLSGSDNSAVKGAAKITAEDWSGRTFKFGVREFAMAAASYGMATTGMVRPLCATFFTFSDYMRNAIRLSALMKLPVIYQFTHDALWLGEDGPTHQPVEQLASLRAMPNLTVFRPCDENELKAAWIEAFKMTQNPVAFILSRQAIKGTGPLTRDKAREGVARGAYVLQGEAGAACDVLMVATGSEVPLALTVAKTLSEQGKTVRIVSMPCWELFEQQDEAYRQQVLGGPVGLRVSLEAGVEMGWHKWIGSDGLAIAVNTFGLSAPLADLQKVYGFTPEAVTERILKALPAKG